MSEQTVENAPCVHDIQPGGIYWPEGIGGPVTYAAGRCRKCGEVQVMKSDTRAQTTPHPSIPDALSRRVVDLETLYQAMADPRHEVRIEAAFKAGMDMKALIRDLEADRQRLRAYVTTPDRPALEALIADVSLWLFRCGELPWNVDELTPLMRRVHTALTSTGRAPEGEAVPEGTKANG